MIRWVWAIASVMSIMLSVVGSEQGAWRPISGDDRQSVVPAATSHQLFLPLIAKRDLFLDNLPIWTASNLGTDFQVGLFRYKFSLGAALQSAELNIFADTRYEVWIDGVWVGRGPARFTQTWREYDTWAAGNLLAGEHVIAVLVQWAPNFRRSESVTPLLQAHLAGNQSGSWNIAASTNTEWKSISSDAWNPGAALVHAWGLIGPTELLDLNKLPESWNQLVFDDQTWGQSVVVNPGQASTARGRIVLDTIFDEFERSVQFTPVFQSALPGVIGYKSRSIPPLEDSVVGISVFQVGQLSPGNRIGEIPSHLTADYDLNFQAANPVQFRIELLARAAPNPAAFFLDATPLTWQAVGALRPDVYQSTRSIGSGLHTLTFKNTPPEGLTFSVPTADLVYQNFPYQQGDYAGRRSLLVELAPNQQAVVISQTVGLEAEFVSPPAYLVLDLGSTVYGRLSASLDGASGTIVDIGWDERLTPASQRPLPYPGSLHQEWNQVDSWILDGTPRQVQTVDGRAGRYVLITVWGNEPVHLRNIQIHREGYPVSQTGFFKSSDPILDDIWQVGVNTSRLNMVEGFTDTPWRERGQWWGDAFVTGLTSNVAFGDRALVRRGIALMAEAFTGSDAPGMSPNNNGLHMVDYSMLWVQSAADEYQISPDQALLIETFPKVKSLMNHLDSLTNPTTGLIDLPKDSWAKTAYIDAYGFHSRYGQSTAVNSIYYATLQEAASLAASLGDQSSATVWTNQSARVKQSIQLLLYLPDQHRYLTTIYLDQPVAPTIHSQVWPLAYGLVPVGEEDIVIAETLSMLSTNPAAPNLDVYGMYWLLLGLGRYDHINDAIQIIKTYYGYMVTQGATTWWEHFNSNQGYYQSLSHSWGSSPTWFLTTYVLGLQWRSQEQWTARPAVQAFKSASGSLPRPFIRGSSGGNETVAISWTRDAGGRIEIYLAAPIGAPGWLELPLVCPGSDFFLDGNPVWQDGAPVSNEARSTGRSVALPIPGGKHTLLVDPGC